VRLIRATIPTDADREVTRRLDENDFEYFGTDETTGPEYDRVISVSVEDEEVEAVLDQLYEAGIDTDDHVVVLKTEVDIFGRAADQTTKAGDHARIAAAELEGQVDDLLPDVRTYVSMMVLSTIVATTGLLLDSAAVVVGSMVIAPLFGPAVSTSVGTVINKRELFRRGVRYQIYGIVTAVATATVFAVLTRLTYLMPTGLSLTGTSQIAARLSPDILSLIVALAAGIAGVLTIATGSGLSVVGVMIAAALLPPAATVGIGIAWDEPMVAMHSGILLGVNVLAINLAGLATLTYLGYRPRNWVEMAQTRAGVLKQAGAIVFVLVVASGFLLNVSYTNAKQAQTEDQISQEVRDVLNDDEYQDVTLLDVKVVRRGPALFPEVKEVVVIVGYPPGDRHPMLPEQVESVVEEQIGREVPVTLRASLLVRQEPDQPPALDRPHAPSR